MTRKEEIMKAARVYANGIAQHLPNKKYCEEDFINGAEWADAHPHWISVEDELPKDDEFYLCVVGNDIEVLFYNEGLEEWYEFYITKEEHLSCDDLTKRVTHWMPLTQAPKKGGNQ